MPAHESANLTSEAPNHSAPFDRNWVLEQIGDDESLLQEIIAVFLDDCPRIEQELLSSLVSGNPDAIYAAAHCAKSAVGNFGAMAAVAAATALERACKESNSAKFADFANTLQQELSSLKTALAKDASLHAG